MAEEHNLTPGDPIWRYVDYWPPEGRPQVPLFLLRAELERAFAARTFECPWLPDKLRLFLFRATQDAPDDAEARAARVLEDTELTELLEEAFLDWARRKMADEAPGPMIFVVAERLERRREALERRRVELADELKRYSEDEQALLAELERRTGRPLSVLLGEPVGDLVARIGPGAGGEEVAIGAFRFARQGARVRVRWRKTSGRWAPERWPLRALVAILRQECAHPVRWRLERLERAIALVDFRAKVAALISWHQELFGTAPGAPPASPLKDTEARMQLVNEWVLEEMSRRQNARLPRGFWEACLKRLQRAWQKAGLSPETFPYRNARSLQSAYNRWASKSPGTRDP